MDINKFVQFLEKKNGLENIYEDLNLGTEQYFKTNCAEIKSLINDDSQITLVPKHIKHNM